MEMQPVSKQRDRRQNPRCYGRDLLVSNNGQGYPVLNISEGGLCFEGTPFAVGQTVVLTLSSLAKPADGVNAECRVVTVRQGNTHLAFTSVTMALLTFVMSHIGEVLGVSPYYFRQDFVAPPIAPLPRQSAGTR